MRSMLCHYFGHRRSAVLALAVVSAVIGTTLVACGGDDPASPPAPTSAAEAPKPEPIKLEVKKLSKTTTDESVEVRGTVAEEGARVVANGKRAKVKGKRFAVTIPLDLGKNKIRIVAIREGFEKGTDLAEVKRTEPVVAQPAPETTTETAPVEPEQSNVDPEAAERAGNCNAPLFVEGACPTDEEVQQENQAESLCGPGTAEGRREAAEQGIEC